MPIYREYKFLLKRAPKESSDFQRTSPEACIKQAFVFNKALVDKLSKHHMPEFSESGLRFQSVRLRLTQTGASVKYTIPLVSDDPIIERFKHEVVVDGQEWERQYSYLFAHSPRVSKARQEYLYKKVAYWKVDRFISFNDDEKAELMARDIAKHRK